MCGNIWKSGTEIEAQLKREGDVICVHLFYARLECLFQAIDKVDCRGVDVKCARNPWQMLTLCRDPSQLGAWWIIGRSRWCSSLVDPLCGVVLPVGETLTVGEPEVDLLVGGLDSVGTVDDVSTDIDAEVTTDGAWGGLGGLGSTEHLAAGENGTITFPDHGADGAGGGVVDESSEEALAGEVSVVLLEVSLAWGAELHADELEALLLEASNDCANESSLDTVGLDHDESSLSLGGFDHLVFVCKEFNSNIDTPTVRHFITSLLSPDILHIKTIWTL